MKNNLISVIVPIYNTQKEDLYNCIQSIINQTYKCLEIILVDDGSKDEISKFCEQIAQQDMRIKVYHNENHGVSWSRNFGFSKSKGDYISFIDGDDLLECNMYEILINDIINDKCDISMCGYNFIENKVVYPIFGNKKKILLNRKNAIISMFDEQSFGVSVWNKLFCRSLIENIKFNEDLKINEDRLFLFDCILKSNHIVYNDICLYNYIKRENSATTCAFSKSRFDILKVNDMIKKQLFTLFQDDNEIKIKYYKNENIYLIRLYRNLLLNGDPIKYKLEKNFIKDRLTEIFKYSKKELNHFDKLETQLIIKSGFMYYFIIRLLVKIKILKKIKNQIQRVNTK